jgi:hypothetical protein
MGRLAWWLGGVVFILIFLWGVLAWLIFSGSGSPPATQKAEARESKIVKPHTNDLVNFKDEAQVSSLAPVAARPLPSYDPTTENAEPVEKIWETQINTILMQEIDIKEIANQIAVILPRLPLDGQLEASQHLVNLSADEDYSKAESVYFNAGLDPNVRRIVFEDLMNRPNAIKLPLLVRTLKEYGHPMRNEALENLQVLTGRNEGNDPARWDIVVQNALEEERKTMQDDRHSPE